MSSTTSDHAKETKWTDAQIRWTEDEGIPDRQVVEEDESYMDPFADPDPLEIFTFKFHTRVEDGGDECDTVDDIVEDNNNENTVELNIHGHKTTSDAVWQSTGLTLWKASKYLCDYMVLHSKELQNKRILEVRNFLLETGWKLWLCYRFSHFQPLLKPARSRSWSEWNTCS